MQHDICVTFDVYSDPSHGWVRVDRSLLQKLQIEGQISSCSYQVDNMLFLEWDRDAALLQEALAALGISMSARNHDSDRDSTVRNCHTFKRCGRSTYEVHACKESILNAVGDYVVTLASCGNIDHGENPDRPLNNVPNSSRIAGSLREASEICRSFIQQHSLGGGNWIGGAVIDRANGAHVADVSYNGRVWLSCHSFKLPAFI